MKALVTTSVFLAAVLVCAGRSPAYPQFQAFSQKHSGRTVNCGMCHRNPEGPDGLKPGQIGSLDKEQLDRLSQARLAFDPGKKIDSPILNAFGDHIIETIGRRRFLELRRQPAGLAEALGKQSDLDEDGIPDAQEFLDGTDPLDAQSGAPMKLFLHNLAQNGVHIVLLFLATICGLYGLHHLIVWFGAIFESPEEETPQP